MFAAGGLGTKAVDFQALAMQQFEQMEKAAAQAVGGGQATAAGGTSDTTDPAGNDPNVAMARALAPAVAAAAAGPGGEAAADGGAAKAKKKKKLSKQEEDALRALRVDDIHEAVRTHGSKRYNRVMTEVRRHAAEGLKIELSEGMLEHDPAYQLVVDANALMAGRLGGLWRLAGGWWWGGWLVLCFCCRCSECFRFMVGRFNISYSFSFPLWEQIWMMMSPRRTSLCGITTQSGSPSWRRSCTRRSTMPVS